MAANRRRAVGSESVPQWVLDHIAEFAKFLGLSFEGRESEVLDLFRSLEPQGGPSRGNHPQGSQGGQNKKLTNELRRLSSSMAFSPSRGPVRGSGHRDAFRSMKIDKHAPRCSRCSKLGFSDAKDIIVGPSIRYQEMQRFEEVKLLKRTEEKETLQINKPNTPEYLKNSSYSIPLLSSESRRKMEQPDGIGIKIYNAAPDEASPYPSSPHPGPETGRKRRAMAKGVQKTISKTSMLVNFLPTGTLLTFEMLLPSVSGDGECSPVSTMMIHALMGLCTLSCFFFHFTDSFRGPDGKIYYGFVTPKGLAVFKPGLGLEVPKDDRFKVGFTDFVHAIMSVMVFVAIAFSDHRVTNCLFPGHIKDMDEVMESFPLMVGVICSSLFLVFPTTRFGIGCMTS
ncbi:hypothetical protein HHK36_024703 [Tetracentron sinense]|uniref:Uncharacterized protein n=1 Tax=Tetracentron sinense TaxID=13715 RepID=A0A835D4W5_TETSI|nr:hypothetical protein HHK36_024703 [Tetracentron sinense]